MGTPMKAVLCRNGHPFDIMTYSECPMCGELPQSKDSLQKKRHWWQKAGKKEDKESINNREAISSKHNSLESSSASKIYKNVIDDEDNTISLYDTDTDEEKTVGLYGNNGDIASLTACSGEDDTTLAFFQSSEKTANDVPSLLEGLNNLRGHELNKTLLDNEETNEDVTPSSLDSEIIDVQDDDKTMGIFEGSSNNVAITRGEPVVGWLVAIKGVHTGESFPLFTGRCSIGRSPQNRVIIDGDKTISRDKHAWIIYEPRNREFWLQAGMESGLTYHNDENLMDRVKLKGRDKIDMGKSSFLFVPLCDGTFSWEDYM